MSDEFSNCLTLRCGCGTGGVQLSCGPMAAGELGRQAVRSESRGSGRCPRCGEAFVAIFYDAQGSPKMVASGRDTDAQRENEHRMAIAEEARVLAERRSERDTVAQEVERLRAEEAELRRRLGR